MKRAIFYILLLLFSLIGIAFAENLVNGDRAKEPPGKSWQQKLGDDNYSYEQGKAAASDSRDSVFIGGMYVSYEEKVKRIFKGLYVWELNPGGKVKDSWQITKDALGIDANFVTAVAVLNDAYLIMTASALDGNTYFVRFALTDGTFIKTTLGGHLFISKIIPFGDRVLAIGSENDNSLFLMLNDSGIVSDKKVFDSGGLDIFVDGIPAKDGKGFILVENSGKSAQFFITDSEVKIAGYDISGNKTPITSFAGRHGSIARGEKGGYALAYDRGMTAGQEFSIKIFDDAFGLVHEEGLFKAGFGMQGIRIAPLNNGLYCVVASYGGRPWMASVGMRGKHWYYQDEKAHPSTEIQIVQSRGAAYLVTSNIELDSERIQKNKINVMKFVP